MRFLPAIKGTSAWWTQLLLCIVWGAPLLGYMRGVINHIPLLKDMTDAIEIAIVVVPLFFSLPHFLRQLKIADYLFVLFCISVYLLSYFNSQSIEYLNENAYAILCLAIPCYFLGRVINFKELEPSFYYVSLTVLLATSFYYLVYSQNMGVGVETDQYNMSASYKTLPHVLMILLTTFKRPKILNILFSVLGILLILAFGTRGPMLCCIVFVIFYVFIFGQFKYKGLALSFYTIIGIILITFLEEIMLFFQVLLSQLNMSTRIVDKFLEDEMGDSSGRDVIAQKLWDLLQIDTNFWGHGFFGYWHYLGGSYSHNLFLDFLLTFGWLWGTILIGFLFLVIFKAFKTKDAVAKAFCLILFCDTIVKLQVSETFILDPMFYMLIGYCITIIAQKKHVIPSK